MLDCGNAQLPTIHPGWAGPPGGYNSSARRHHRRTDRTAIARFNRSRLLPPISAAEGANACSYWTRASFIRSASVLGSLPTENDSFRPSDQDDITIPSSWRSCGCWAPWSVALHVLSHLSREFTGHDPAVLFRSAAPSSGHQRRDEWTQSGAVRTTVSSFGCRGNHLDRSFFGVVFGDNRPSSEGLRSGDIPPTQIGVEQKE